MFRLKKLHPPFGTVEAPQYESSYSEGLIKVVDGICEVQREASRDYLLKIGYEPVELEEAAVGPSLNGHSNDNAADDSPPDKRVKQKKKNRR